MSDAANGSGRARSALSRRAFIGGSAAVAGSTLLGACSDGARTPESAESADVLRLTFLTILPPQSLTFAPELFADAAGYFADHGLDATELTASVPAWLQADHDALTAKVLRKPERREITTPVQEQLIVELYSK